ncbi:MAG TPA: hypothetical protein VFG10_18990 [Saprospiraceae bacterium]|nr:hypothetical protein [Saprospiraceae bacterium]
MLGIKIKNKFISLYADTALTFDIYHPMAIIMESVDELKGGYSFPLDIPLDEINIGIIGRIDRLDRNATLLNDEYCEVWCEGVPLYIGKAYMKKSGNKRAELFMVFNEVKEIGSTSLEAIDLGGDRSIGADTATRLAHAKDTAVNPLDYDYIFCPVFNPLYFDTTDLPFPIFRYQNFWDVVTSEFIEQAPSSAMPFIRVDYLLKQIFKYQGYTLDNQWQITDELKQIILYNNRSIYRTVDEWAETINLAHHVPFRTAVEFLRAICSTFGLGLFYDHFNKTALIKPFRDMINSPIAADWTSKAGADFGYTEDINLISQLRYDIDTNDDLSVRYSGITAPPGLIFGEGLTARILQAAFTIGPYYTKADNSIYFIPLPGSDIPYTAQYHNPVIKNVKGEKYISPLIPMWNSWNIKLNGDVDDTITFQEWMLPHIRHIGYTVIENSGQSSYKTPLTSFRMMIYRGMQPADVGHSETYPMANATAYNIRGDKVGDYSLHWDGQYGIYAQWWSQVYHMLANKSDVTRSLLLTISDLLSFRFYNKYRIENQNYFISRMRYTLTMRGISPIEATMMSTL